MAFVTMLLTLPLLYLSYEKQHESEHFYIVKLLFLWLLCQLYISINHKLKFPIGIILTSVIIYYDKVNKKSKITATMVGCISYLTSNLVYFLYKI